MHSTLPKILLVSIQLLAIMLLQMPMFLPLAGKVFSFHPRAAVCHHDHQLCGCSPERIASHTCCCSRPAGKSRMTADHGQEDGEASCCTHEQGAKIRHTLKVAPCGAASPLFIASVQDFFCLQHLGEIVSPASVTIPSFDNPESLLVRYSDPPNPPPEIFLSV